MEQTPKSLQSTLSKRVDSSEKNTSINKKIKDLVKEKLYNSFAQAIFGIIEAPNKILKVFIFTFVIVSSGLAAYLVIQAILTYLTYPVLTSTRTLFETPTLFPKITICNQNPFITEYALEYVRNRSLIVMSNIDIFNINQTLRFNYSEKVNQISKVRSASLQKMSSSSLSNDRRLKMAHSFDDILAFCSFNSQPCSSSDFVWQFDKNYGNCYIFNSGYNSSGSQIDLKKSYIAGVDDGLVIKMYVNYNENLNMFNSISRSKGALIRIGNSSYLTDYHQSDGISISPGLVTRLALDRQFESNKPKPYSTCDIDNSSPVGFNSEFYNLISNSVYAYNQQLCFALCGLKKLLEHCNCTDSNVFSLYNTSSCIGPAKADCCFNITTNVLKKSDFILNTCTPLCPLECNSTYYKYSISTSNIIGDVYEDYIKENANLSSDFVTTNITAERAAQSFVHVYIFYNSLSYIFSQESAAMDVVSLMASIGGNLSLFLGVSVFSLFEVFEVLIEIFFLKINSK